MIEGPGFECMQKQLENFLLQSAFCVDSYFSVRSTAVLPQWHVKDPGHFAESAVACYSYTHMHHTYVALHEVKRLGDTSR